MRNISLEVTCFFTAILSIIPCSAWSPDANNRALSKGRRSAITQLVGIFSVTTGISIAGGNPSAAIASTSDSRPTTDELRKIYDAGAEGYESVYTESIVSRTLDFSTLRSNLLARARGDVLELGVGTGLNLPHYPPNDVAKPNIDSYTGMDLSTKMMELAQGRFLKGTPQVSSSLEALYKDNKVRFEVGDVNNLEDVFNGAAKFNTVVDTFSLCVFPDPSRALKQANLVLKPGGRLLLLEHQDSLVSKSLSPTRNTAVSGTCRYDDDVRALVKEAGFSIESSKNLAGGFLVEVVAIKK